MEIAKRYKYLIWDFDGTVNDTSQGIYATFRSVLSRFGIDASTTDLSEHIGPPLKYSYTKLVGEENCDKAIDLHRQVFAELNAVALSRVYDGVWDVLDKLYKSGKYVMCIASCKYEQHLLESLKMLNLEKYFTYVYAQTPTRLYKSDVIRQLLDDNGINACDCVMIGDTLHDAEGASENGVDFMGVTYGFGKREELTKVKNVALCSSPAEILQLLL